MFLFFFIFKVLFFLMILRGFEICFGFIFFKNFYFFFFRISTAGIANPRAASARIHAVFFFIFLTFSFFIGNFVLYTTKGICFPWRFYFPIKFFNIFLNSFFRYRIHGIFPLVLQKQVV